MSNFTNTKDSDNNETLKELKPCKGSITRILMDGGIDKYENNIHNKKSNYEEINKKWRQERLNEYNRLSERESDLISFTVYEHILSHNTPWYSFESFLNENEMLRKDKMEKYELTEKEKPAEESTFPSFEEYESENEYLEYEDSFNSYSDFEDDENYDSNYEWEEEYENYESSDDDEYDLYDY